MHEVICCAKILGCASIERTDSDTLQKAFTLGQTFPNATSIIIDGEHIFALDETEAGITDEEIDLYIEDNFP